MRLGFFGGLLLVLSLGAACSPDAERPSDPAVVTSGEMATSGAAHGAMGGMMAQRDPDPSRNFALNMIEHHRGAVTMSQSALSGELDPEMRALAQKIIGDQEREIAQMQAFLSRGQAAR